MLLRKAETKAPTIGGVQERPAKVTPSSTIASPSAMMTKPAQRSAMCPPSTYQSSTAEAPYFGIQKRTSGETYSIASAIPHSHKRSCPLANPPRIQNTADVLSQMRMRIAFQRVDTLAFGVDTSQ